MSLWPLAVISNCLEQLSEEGDVVCVWGFGFRFKYGTGPLNLLEDQWCCPQRVVAQRAQVRTREVLVKWFGLSHEELSWERVDHPVLKTNVHLIRNYDKFEAEVKLVEKEMGARGGGEEAVQVPRAAHYV